MGDFKKGASRSAVQNYISSNWGVNFTGRGLAALRNALKKAVDSGDLTREGVRYKLNAEKRKAYVNLHRNLKRRRLQRKRSLKRKRKPRKRSLKRKRPRKSQQRKRPRKSQQRKRQKKKPKKKKKTKKKKPK